MIPWRRRRPVITAEPGKLAGGSAVSEPFALLAVEEEARRAGRSTRDGGGAEAANASPAQTARGDVERGDNRFQVPRATSETPMAALTAFHQTVLIVRKIEASLRTRPR
jgi:hypothetical protein